MIRLLLTLVICLSLSWSSLRAQDEKVDLPKGQAPRFFVITGMGRITVLLKEIVPARGGLTEVREYEVALKDIDIHDVVGKSLSTTDFRKRARVGEVILVAADEKRIDPLYLTVVKEQTLVLHGVKAVQARNEKWGPEWTMDPAKMKFVDGQIAGKLFGADFKAESAVLQATGLSVRSGRDNMHIFLRLKPGEGIAGKTYEYGPDTPAAPAIHLHVLSTNPPTVTSYQKGYAMRLEFGKEMEGELVGKLYLCLPDDRKSAITGTFAVSFK